ncbi:uncharacterized protein N7469_002168 [Penicillium citrinum]|uniref:Uncharacterized protein n=1 Tax=Penicillium citrinum TaxID=5077 RepID=A0A9W9TTF3_PENCI|nr:uncharacterized protein N7469_002168 [Penicillium citrinum]KAJ5240577.1 hypothetical protein N7469_002168 [Penicillium citrinum]
MDGLIGLAEILQERVSAWMCFYEEQYPDLSQKLKEIIPFGAPNMTSPPAATFDCPNTRKNKRDYAALHKYGLLAEDVPLPRPRKKMAVRPALNSPTTPVSTSPTAPSNVSISLSNLDTDICPSQSISQVECETECAEIKQRDGTRLKERSWAWKYYQTTPESGTWKLGDKERPEFKHRCIKLRSSTTALKQHLQQTHKLFQDDHLERQGPLSSWITKGKKLPFEEATLDWIISTCQPFICVEQPSFRAMLRSVDLEASIPSADTVSRRLDLRLDALDGELRILMALASSIALSLDGWTSQNSLPMLAINAHWMSSAFQQHRACIDFVEITGNHSGENLANIVATVLERFHISDKVITIWIARSPQRIQKWDNRPGCTKAIHYGVATRSNYNSIMIERAEECRRQLENTISKPYASPNDWRQLSNIDKILTPFNEYIEYVSPDSPSIHMTTWMFEKLLSILLAIKERRGDWQNVSPALTVPMSDGITLLEHYHGCVKDNDIYYIAKAFQPSQYNVAEYDIDRYFATPAISTRFDISQSQAEFIRNWWKINRHEFTCMAKVAQDHLAIPEMFLEFDVSP